MNQYCIRPARLVTRLAPSTPRRPATLRSKPCCRFTATRNICLHSLSKEQTVQPSTAVLFDNRILATTRPSSREVNAAKKDGSTATYKDWVRRDAPRVTAMSRFSSDVAIPAGEAMKALRLNQTQVAWPDPAFAPRTPNERATLERKGEPREKQE